MNNVMNLAWKNARAGAAKFGGKPSEYFAESLRLAQDGIDITISHAEQFATEMGIDWVEVILVPLFLLMASFFVGLVTQVALKEIADITAPMFTVVGILPLAMAAGLYIKGDKTTIGGL